MPRSSLVVALTTALAPLASLPAQLSLTTVYATPPTVQLGSQLASLPDVDGNARPDFLIASYSPTQSRVQLVSSTTFGVLGTLTVPGLYHSAGVADT